VKVLGAVALIDEGETDWKVLAIDVEDPLAAEIDDISSLEAKMPGNDLQDLNLRLGYSVLGILKLGCIC